MPCKGVNEPGGCGEECWAVALCRLGTDPAVGGSACFTFPSFFLASSAAFTASELFWAGAMCSLTCSLDGQGREAFPLNKPRGGWCFVCVCVCDCALGMPLWFFWEKFPPGGERQWRLLPGRASGFYLLQQPHTHTHTRLAYTLYCFRHVHGLQDLSQGVVNFNPERVSCRDVSHDCGQLCD